MCMQRSKAMIITPGIHSILTSCRTMIANNSRCCTVDTFSMCYTHRPDVQPVPIYHYLDASLCLGTGLEAGTCKSCLLKISVHGK